MSLYDRAPYPITILMDRYNGIYSGGRWLAFNLDPEEIPNEIGGGDSCEMNFFYSPPDWLVFGKGNSPEEALEDLIEKLQPKLRDVTPSKVEAT